MPGAADAPRAPRLRRWHVGLALAVAVVAGMLGGIAIHALRGAPAPTAAVARPVLHGQATWPDGARPAPAITTLHDQTGRPFSLATLRGRTVAVAFLDSHCTQACPLEGRALAAGERALPASARPTLVAVSVNPLDTPASVQRAMRAWGLANLAPWHWLLGARARLAKAWKAYRIFVYIPAHGDIVHTEALYLLGRDGSERSAYLYPFLPRFVSADLRALAGRS